MWGVEHRASGFAADYPGWYVVSGDGWRLGPHETEAEARERCDKLNARGELVRRQSAAIDRAVKLGVSAADLYRAIDEGTLLQFEEPADEPLVVKE